MKIDNAYLEKMLTEFEKCLYNSEKDFCLVAGYSYASPKFKEYWKYVIDEKLVERSYIFYFEGMNDSRGYYTLSNKGEEQLNGLRKSYLERANATLDSYDPKGRLTKTFGVIVAAILKYFS